MTGRELKADWLSLPNECFETTTFGELKVGQYFIGLPLPGDNHGHGGFRGSSRVFIKTHDLVMETDGTVNLPYSPEVPHGCSIGLMTGIVSDFPLGMAVIALC